MNVTLIQNEFYGGIIHLRSIRLELKSVSNEMIKKKEENSTLKLQKARLS